jgi:hypothetical protein
MVGIKERFYMFYILLSPRGINGKKFSTRQNLSNNLSPYLELG